MRIQNIALDGLIAAAEPVAVVPAWIETRTREQAEAAGR